MAPPRLRALHRSDWGFVRQDPRTALRMGVTAGGNVGERLMAAGVRNYADIRARPRPTGCSRWRSMPAASTTCRAHFPAACCSGCRSPGTLVTHPRLVFMDEPTGGLDVSVQARLLDLIRGLVARLGIAVVLVTHDIAVARLLAGRIMVMHARPGGGGWIDRPGAGRPATPLYAIARQLGAAGMSVCVLRTEGLSKHFTCIFRVGWTCRCCMRWAWSCTAGECVALHGPSGGREVHADAEHLRELSRQCRTDPGAA